MASAGTLSATMSQIERVTVRLGGDGALHPSASSAIQYVAADFNNLDSSETGTLYSGLSAWWFTYADHPVDFSGGGTLFGDMGDGLRAQVTGQYAFSDSQGSDGTISATLSQKYALAVGFTGGSLLSFAVEGGNDGLSATALPGATGAGGGAGTLAATARMYSLNIAAALGGSGTLTGAMLKLDTIPMEYDDTFNRANSSDCGSSWTQQFAGNPLHVNSNQAQPTSSGSWSLAKWATVMPTRDVVVTVTVGAVNGVGDAMLIYTRSNSSQQVAIRYWDGYWDIMICTGGDYSSFSNPTFPVSVGPGQSISPGDVIEWTTVGSRYLLKQNGNTVFDVDDLGFAVYPYANDGNHREVAVGYYTPSGSAAVGIDSWHAKPVGMLSGNGSLTATLVPQRNVAAAFGGGGTLTATAGFPSHSAELTSYTTPGSYTYTIPYWCNKFDIIVLGGGGAGGKGGLLNTGPGGSAATWQTVTITRGTDIGWSTASVTGNVGAKGNHNGGAGGNSTAVATGMTTLSSTGGAGGTAACGWPGCAPGNKTFNVYTYTGGSAGGGGGGNGTAPGGAGGGGNLFNGAGGDGAAGVVHFYAYQ